MLSDRFEVVFVCTGNRCRSPVAKALLEKLTPGYDLDVRSIGIQDVGPVPPPEDTLVAASSLGIDLSDHRSASMRLGELKDTDLVIGFEQRHVARAVVEGGADRARAFTLLELADLLGDQNESRAPHEDVRTRAGEILTTAHRVRQTEPGTPRELPDPIGKPASKHAKVATAIADAVTTIANSLFPTKDRS